MRFVIGLGANLGDRLGSMRAAIAAIANAGALILAKSRVYETAPVGGPPQPDYLNAAILIDWPDTAIALLDCLQAIEAELGRVREARNGPRTIDLDVLWSDGPPIDEPRLVVPHPRLHERAFALRPLHDVAPEARLVPHEMIEDIGCRATGTTLG